MKRMFTNRVAPDSESESQHGRRAYAVIANSDLIVSRCANRFAFLRLGASDAKTRPQY